MDSSDMRRKRIVLTDKGREVLAKLDEVYERIGVERMVLICDFERTVPALLPQPGDRDGQKAPP